MLKLRKILLLNYIYYLFLLLVISITIIRLSIPKESIYNLNTNIIEGKIINIKEQNQKVTLIIKEKEKIQVTYYKNKINKQLNLGDKIKVKGEIKEITPQKTKYLFDYKAYLYRKSIYYSFSASEIKIIKPNRNILYFIKQKIINSFNNNPYLNTFIIGDKSLISQEVKKSYQENGISHLFAISGMHITLLVTMIEKLLLKLKVLEEKRFKIITVILILYLLLVGLSPSILRGILFYLIFKINSIYYFYIKPINLFIIVISIALLINPNYIFDIGFQYSYLISLSLLLCSEKLKSKNYLISLLKVSLLSFIVSIPITLYNFNQLNLLSIIYNLFFVPLISLIIFPFTLIIIILKPLEPIYNLLIFILEKTSLFLDKICFCKLLFIRLPGIVYLVYLVIIFLIIFRKKKEYLIILLTILLIHFIYPYFNKESYINFIDVGQGDSILIHKDNKNILIDTGGSLTTKNTISNNTIIPILKSKAIKKLDYIILSHGDADHMGEALNLVKNIKIKNVIFNCGKYNKLEKELISYLKEKNINYYSCINELNIEELNLYFLNTIDYNDENENSSVIYTEINNKKILLMGDAGEKREKDILEKYNLENIDILKVGHHGSDTSSSKEFISRINPKNCYISVGLNNKFNHPKKSVIDTLNDYCNVYRTDQNGSIEIKLQN